MKDTLNSPFFNACKKIAAEQQIKAYAVGGWVR
jgi:tRNA nucleotidyltransferase/poly(A) polymerase